jgi:hypothetical protein
MKIADLTEIYALHPSVLRQVHNLFRSEFSKECNLMLPLSISITVPFPYSHPVAAYVFFLVFP